MPACRACGEEDSFDCLDGLFFCSYCQTQSQDIRDEQEEAEFLDFGSFSAPAVIEKKEKKKKETKVVDKGRMWSSYEGFQHIIQEQVKALLKLGARTNLQEAVWRIWVLYLSKVGVAFTKTDKPASETFASKLHPRHRDTFHASLEDPVVKPLRFRRNRRDNFGESVRKAEKRIEKSNLESSIQTEEFYEGDNPVEDGQEDPEDEDELLWEDDREEGVEEEGAEKKYSRTKGTEKDAKWSHIGRMSLPKTIAFCYLGLLYTKSLTGPGHLVRWIKQGQIPYYSVSSLFPDNLKFSSCDAAAFNAKKLPSSESIRYLAGKMANFLNIRETVPTMNIPLLIHQNIINLQLPADLHGLTANSGLLKRRPPVVKFMSVKNGMSVPNYDAIAMAYIIITLKLLLGLDDQTERKLSTYARKLMKFGQFKQPLFVWEDWYEHMEKLEAQKQEFFVPATSEQIEEIRDVGAFTEQFENYTGIRRRYSINRNMTANPFGVRPEIRENIQQPFTLLSEKWKNRNPHVSAVCGPTPFPEDPSYSPSGIATMMEEDPIGFLVDSPQKRSMRRDQKKCAATSFHVENVTDFRRTSLKYITQQNNFLEELDKQGLSDFTIQSSCVSDSDAESSSEEPCSHSSIRNLSPSQTRKRPAAADDRDPEISSENQAAKRKQRKKRNAAKEAILHAISQHSSHTDQHGQSSTSSSSNEPIRMQDFMQNYERAYEQYFLYSDKTSGQLRHRSYDWLLKLCASMIGCCMEEVDAEVQKLQLVYVTPITQQDTSSKHKLNFCFKSYFS